MSSLAHDFSASTAHTFGHLHLQPPPLPGHLQGAALRGCELGAAPVFSRPGADGLLLELDQLVRSIGEW